MRQKRAARLISAVLIAAAVIALAVLFAFQAGKPRGSGNSSTGKTVEELLGLGEGAAPVYYKGKEYRLNPDLESYLFMGIDRRGEVEDGGSHPHGGHADVLLVLVLDRTRERVTALQLDRDTMTEIAALDSTGKEIGTQTLQLEYAHYYGSGGEDSCENTVRAVSGLLFGVELDGYAALQMDCIPVLNDAVGGVTVTIEDDFSQIDPELTMGSSVTLLGEHAWNYVHSRKDVGDGFNMSRMRRHRTYLDAFTEKLEVLMAEDAGIAAKLYQAAGPYMVTDMGSGTVVDLLEEARGYENAGIVTLEGESRVDEAHNVMEFHADEASVRETVLELFYLETDNKTGG